MNEISEKPRCRSWLWNLLILILLGGLLFVFAIPNFVRSGPSKLNGIVNNLRQLAGAKEQWAFEHGITNFAQIANMTNQPSEQDLTPYFRFPNKQGGLFPSVAGEVYSINPLNKSPEAKVIHKIDRPWPKGSIIRFSDNTNAELEILFPDGTKTSF